jgi:spermidine/putrescine-binding protein
MLSGKTFAGGCKWIVDPRYPGQPKYAVANANTGDRVFINGDLVYAFVRSLPIYKRKHVYVIHNSDQPFDEGKLNALLPTAIHIYAINTTVKHPKLTTIPLGFPDAALDFVANFKRPDVPRDIEIYLNFSINTNVQKRLDCYNAFKDDPRVVIKGDRTREQYYEDLCRSKYVLCPEGTGIDTHRVWEAIFCGATPVVLRNPLAELYVAYPVKIVDSWTDLTTVPS